MSACMGDAVKKQLLRFLSPFPDTHLSKTSAPHKCTNRNHSMCAGRFHGFGLRSVLKLLNKL